MRQWIMHVSQGDTGNIRVLPPYPHTAFAMLNEHRIPLALWYVGSPWPWTQVQVNTTEQAWMLRALGDHTLCSNQNVFSTEFVSFTRYPFQCLQCLSPQEVYMYILCDIYNIYILYIHIYNICKKFNYMNMWLEPTTLTILNIHLEKVLLVFEMLKGRNDSISVDWFLW